MGTFATLITELKARGYDYLSDARAGQFINDAYHEICEQADWPFLETTATGTAPLTISDLKAVLYVDDATNDRVLQNADVRWLRERYGTDLATAGLPVYWWLDGTTTLKVQPPNTAPTLSVRYVKVPADLTGTDTPVIPTRFHSAIVDVAEAIAAAKDESNDKDQAVVRAEVDRVVGRMGAVFLNRALDGPQYIQTTAASSDW